MLVADAYQRRGIGTRLLEQLAERAAAVGIERFVAEVLAENRPMLGVFEAVGFESTRTLESGTVEVEFRIEPTETYLERVDERDHLAAVASLRPFFAPTSCRRARCIHAAGIDRRPALPQHHRGASSKASLTR